jgi:hypothetical protein
MAQFLFLYRGGTNLRTGAARPSPEQMQQVMQKWAVWMKELETKGHLIDRGHPLDDTGKTVKGTSKKVITDGPYAEKDLVGGFTLVNAKDLAEATELTAGCPIFEADGLVEVRTVMAM